MKKQQQDQKKQVQAQVPIKDFYSVQDVADLLGISVNQVREYSSRLADPLPFRRLAWMARGMFIMRSDLKEWAVRNAPLVSDLRAMALRDADEQDDDSEQR